MHLSELQTHLTEQEMHLNNLKLNFNELKICESGQHSPQTRKNPFIYWRSGKSTPTPTLTPTPNHHPPRDPTLVGLWPPLGLWTLATIGTQENLWQTSGKAGI